MTVLATNPDGRRSERRWFSIDATDFAKGQQQYWLRFGASPKELANKQLVMRTICQANASTMPHLKDGENRITYASSDQAICSVGPHLSQVESKIVEGSLKSSSVTLDLRPPRNKKAPPLYAASWQSSGNPPAPVDYRIDYSLDE